MKERVPKKIIKSTLVLFSENYYHDVSVLEICNMQNISSIGIFIIILILKRSIFSSFGRNRYPE